VAQVGLKFPIFLPQLGYSHVLLHLAYENRSFGQVLVAHDYNLCYSGGRDQEDRGLRPAQAKRETPFQKYPTHTHTEKGLVK
jgi:hypothetical protein